MILLLVLLTALFLAAVAWTVVAIDQLEWNGETTWGKVALYGGYVAIVILGALLFAVGVIRYT